jgi:hypothetical protein
MTLMRLITIIYFSRLTAVDFILQKRPQSHDIGPVSHHKERRPGVHQRLVGPFPWIPKGNRLEYLIKINSSRNIGI